MVSLSHFAAKLRLSARSFRSVILLLIGMPVAWAHFPFSYSAAESIGLVQAVLPTRGVSVDPDIVLPRTEYDYLRLQPFVTGYTWNYRGTISNTRTTVPAELRVEVLSATASGAGASAVIEYTLRHTFTIGTASAVTTISGIVTDQGDRVLTTKTVPTAPGLPTLERTFLDGGLLGMPRRLMTGGFGSGSRVSPYARMSYARVSEQTSGAPTNNLGSLMGIDLGMPGTTTTALGTFETLSVAQTLTLGPLTGAPRFNSDGDITSLPFTGRPPNITITSAYAMDVGPIRIAWTQTEAQREPVTGVMLLVATSFPATPRPLRQPQVVGSPQPCALEPGATLVLTADIIGITPVSRSFSAPSATEVTDDAGTQYRWTTPRGARWTRSSTFYLENVTTADAGDYQLEVVASTGTSQSSPVRVTITPRAASSRLINVASRAPSGRDTDTIIAGIVLNPAAANAPATRRLLFRAVGPALRAFGIAEAETDPALVVYDSANREIARCDNWDSSRDVADRVSAAVAALGTFPLPAGSRDAALTLDLTPGAYTAHLLSSNNATPTVGLVEIYDASANDPAGPRIANLSTRCRIGAGDQILIPGIVVTDGSARLLVRALGPALIRYGITDALPDPEITLYADNTPIAFNDDWSADTTTSGPVSQAAQLAGAAPLNGGKDAALLATLPPGSYTLHVRSHNPRQTGVVVAEVFLLNP